VDRIRTSRSIDALGVDAIERGAGGVVAVGAASRRANRDSGAAEDADGLGVGVGAGRNHSNEDGEDEGDSEDTHDVWVRVRVSKTVVKFSSGSCFSPGPREKTKTGHNPTPKFLLPASFRCSVGLTTTPSVIDAIAFFTIAP
jgi:hypothetical protein